LSCFAAHVTVQTLFSWLGSQPVLFSHIISASAASHQPASNIFLSQQISISHRPPATSQPNEAKV
jgi:hypothetical protein